MHVISMWTSPASHGPLVKRFSIRVDSKGIDNDRYYDRKPWRYLHRSPVTIGGPGDASARRNIILSEAITLPDARLHFCGGLILQARARAKPCSVLRKAGINTDIHGGWHCDVLQPGRVSVCDEVTVAYLPVDL